MELIKAENNNNLEGILDYELAKLFKKHIETFNEVHWTIYDIYAELKIWLLVLIKTELIYCRSMKNDIKLKYTQIHNELRVNTKFTINFFNNKNISKVKDIKIFIINKVNDLRYKQLFDINEVY